VPAQWVENMATTSSAALLRALQVLAAVITVFSFVTGVTSLVGEPASLWSGSSVQAPAHSRSEPPRYDRIAVSVGKFLVVILVLFAATVATVPALLIDAIMAPWGADIPNLRRVWSRALDGVCVGWFWQPLNPALLFFYLTICGVLVVVHFRRKQQVKAGPDDWC
jgi:hypothetical protein